MRFDNLDRDTRAVALVGYFLQEFAWAEQYVTAAIGLLLGLSQAQWIALIGEMPVAAKFKALKDMVPDLPKPIDQRRVSRCMSDLLKANDLRKRLAHLPFGPGSKDLRVETLKGEVFKEWTTDEFLTAMQPIVVANRRTLRDLTNHLGMMEVERLLRDHAARMSERIASRLRGEVDND